MGLPTPCRVVCKDSSIISLLFLSQVCCCKNLQNADIFPYAASASRPLYRSRRLQ